jgi:hypothetical protein
MLEFRYGFIDKNSVAQIKSIVRVPIHKENLFFQTISDLTGLDRSIAEAIMENNPIEHPDFTFLKLTQNEPSDLTRIGESIISGAN